MRLPLTLALESFGIECFHSIFNALLKMTSEPGAKSIVIAPGNWLIAFTVICFTTVPFGTKTIFRAAPNDKLTIHSGCTLMPPIGVGLS